MATVPGDEGDPSAEAPIAEFSQGSVQKKLSIAQLAKGTPISPARKESLEHMI